MFKFFKELADYKKEMTEYACKARELLETDRSLVDALFEPAILSGSFRRPFYLDWRNESCEEKSSSFSESLLPLSEYYMYKNGVLSTAIWGIWNTIRLMRAQRSIINALRENSERKNADFLNYRGLVATAALQFADGTAYTEPTSDALYRIDDYKSLAAEAIQHLKVYADIERERNRVADIEDDYPDGD